MILDKVLHGVLDQGRGCLLVYDEPEVDVRFPWTIDFLALMSCLLVALEHVWRCYRYARASQQCGGLVVRKGTPCAFRDFPECNSGDAYQTVKIT
ncbi:hypothetical protein OG21DRAFT_1505368 [Imleria badia]|nr:hypothetical protein OG21DRAFT_1505368 [Imleria badia]